MAAKTKKRRRIAAAFLLLVALPAGAYLGLHSTAGREMIAAKLSTQLSALLDDSVRITGIHGWIPFNVSVDTVTIGTTADEWLAIERLSANLRVTALGRGMVEFESLTAETVALDMAKRPQNPEPSYEIPSIPTPPGWLRIRNATVQRFEWRSAEPTESAAIALAFEYEPSGGDETSRIRFDAEDIDHPDSYARGEIEAAADRLIIQARLHDERHLPRIFDLAGPVDMEINGGGPMSNWSGAFAAHVAGEPFADAEFVLAGENETRFGFQGKLRPDRIRPDTMADYHLDHEWTVEIAGNLSQSGMLTLTDATLATDILRANASVTLDLETKAHDIRLLAEADDIYELPFAPTAFDGVPATFRIESRGDAERTDLVAELKTTSDSLRGNFASNFAWNEERFSWNNAVLSAAGFSRFLPASLGEWTGDQIEIATNGSWELQPQLLQLALVNLSTDPITVSGSANWSPAQDQLNANFEGNIDIPATDARPISAKTRFTVTANGTSSEASAAIRITELEGFWQDAAARADALTLSAHAPTALSEIDTASIDLELAGSAIDLSWQEKPALVRARLDASVSVQEFMDAQLSRFSLTDDALNAIGDGEWDADNGWSANFEVSSENVVRFAQFADLDYDAMLRTTITASGGANFDAVSLTLDGNLGRVTGLPEPLAKLFSAPTEMSASVDFADTIELKQSQLRNAHLDVNASASANLSEETLDARWEAMLPDIGFLAESGQDFSGAATATGTVTGAFDALRISAIVESDEVELFGNRLANLTADINGEVGADSQQAELSLSMNAFNRSIQAQAAAHFDSGILTLEEGAVRSGEDRVSVSGYWNLDDEALEATMLVRVENTAAYELGDFTLPTARIGGEAQVQKDAARWISRGGLNLGAWQWQDTRFETADITWDGTWSENAYNGTAAMELTNAAWSGAHDVSANVTAEGRGADIGITGNTVGLTFDENEWSAEFQSVWRPAEERVRLSQLNARLADESLRLREATEIQYANDAIVLGATDIELSGGRITAAGTFDTERVDAQAAWEKLPLRWLEILTGTPFEGSTSGTVNLSGTEFLLASMEASVEEMRFGYLAKTSAPVTTGTITFDLDDTALNGRMNLAMGDDQYINGQFSYPAQFAWASREMRIDDNAPINGQLDLNIDLAYLDDISGAESHEVHGRLIANVTLSGPADAPAVAGSANLENAAYAYAETGTRIDDLTGTIRFDNDQILLENFRGTARRTGTINLDGTLSTHVREDFPLDIRVQLTDFRMLDRDDLVADADGELRLAGTLLAPTLSGRLELNDTTFVANPSNMASTPTLDFVEINVPPERQRDESETESLAPDLTLDLVIAFPYRARVLATDLRSEWQGELRVIGTLDDPRIDGTLTVQSGRLTLIGRRFDIERDGVLQFDRTSPIDQPFINLSATTIRDDLTGRVTLSGVVPDLKLTLASDPPLPEEETLSRIFFGTDSDNISPSQAYQLARAAVIFSGNTGSVPFLGPPSSRGIFDELSVGLDDGEVSVGVGVYLTDRSYVRVEQGTEIDDRRVSVNIDLLPNLKLQGYAGADAESGIGLEWRKDY